jgi:predicted permease
VEHRIEPRRAGAPTRVGLDTTRWVDTRVEPALTAAIAGIAACAALGVAIVTLNLVLLALARLELRRDELAIRSALGARRADLFGAVAADLVLIFLPALAAAWLLARLGLVALASAAPSLRFGAVTLSDLELGWDSAALLLALAAAMLIATLVVPALAVRRATGAAAPKSRDGARAGRAQRAIAAVQFALATALAIGAAVAGGAAWRAITTPLGFDPSGVLSAQVSIPSALAPADGTAGFLARMKVAMAALPGVASAASAACIPIQGGCDNVTIESIPKVSGDDWPVALALVDGDYFRTLAIPLRSGRVFDAHDDAAAAPVVVLSESAARNYFPAGDAIGRRLAISVGWPERPEGATIVGIVADVLGATLDDRAEPAVYVPSAQLAYDDNYLLLRATPGVDARSLLTGLTRELARVEPRLALSGATTMTQRFDDLTARRRVAALLIAALATLAAVLAGSGVFAVFALSVRRRRREFAVRMAVGASAASLRRGVLGDSITLAVGAAFAGLVLGAAAAKALATVLPAARAGDAGIYALVAAAMTLIALAASWWPAREAARVEPMRLLARDGSG